MVGQTISHYRILRELGAGGMGVVYRAEDTRLQRPVALKFLSAELSRDARAVERFQREARAASSLSHPNICAIYDVGDQAGQHFIAMECLEKAYEERFNRLAYPRREAVWDDLRADPRFQDLLRRINLPQ